MISPTPLILPGEPLTAGSSAHLTSIGATIFNNIFWYFYNHFVWVLLVTLAVGAISFIVWAVTPERCEKCGCPLEWSGYRDVYECQFCKMMKRVKKAKK